MRLIYGLERNPVGNNYFLYIYKYIENDKKNF